MKYTIPLMLAVLFSAVALNAQQARLQVVHNAADPATAQVDVYLNGSLLLDDFTFRAATPFVDVPAGVQLSIGVAPANSTGSQDIIATFTPTLDDGKKYIAIANGVLNPAMFAANPDMKNIAFTILTADDARESAMNAGEVDLKVLHGASDAPAVDVIARGIGTLVDDAAYGDMTPYLSVPAGSYTIDITPAADNSIIVASFTADLSSLGGGAALVFASGFLNPAANLNGQAFGLFAALPDGTVIPLSAVTSVPRESAPLPAHSLTAYPNPARGQTNLRFSIERDAAVTLSVFDLSGRVIYSVDRGQLAPGQYDAALSFAGLSTGIYRVVLSTSIGITSTMVSVLR